MNVIEDFITTALPVIEQEVTFEIPVCPDPWASRHQFLNTDTGQIVPARCKRWTCYACAQKNYYRVAHLASLGQPERFVTLTRAGTTPNQIRFNLQKLMTACKREALEFEYFSVPELHANGQAHIHLLQRGDYIDQNWLSEKWATYTAKDYGDQGSFIVDIRRINDQAHARRYLLKYLKKSWQGHDNKSWENLQRLYPGLNHYRYSRNYVPEKPEKPEGWILMPRDPELVEVQPIPAEDKQRWQALNRKLSAREILMRD